jgi:hypothetical protein
MYKGEPLPLGLPADILVDETVILEIKAVPALLPAGDMQLQSYLRISVLLAGPLLNFHALRLKTVCDASSDDGVIFSVAHRGSRSASVLKDPWPDTRSGIEWLDAGQQHNNHVRDHHVHIR